MEPRRVPKHPILHRSPVCTLFGRFWVPFGSHFWHRFRHFWGTCFCVFWQPKKYDFPEGTEMEPFWRSFLAHFPNRPKVDFWRPLHRKHSFFPPSGSPKWVKKRCQNGVPKKVPQKSEKVPQKDPLGAPFGHQKGYQKSVEKTTPKKH